MPLPQVFEVKSPRRRPRPSDNDWTLLLKRVTEEKIRRNPLFFYPAESEPTLGRGILAEKAKQR